MPRPVRRRIAAGLFCLLGCTPAVLPAPAHADAGTYTYMLCANPDTGRGTAASDGVFPEGVTMQPGHINMTTLQSAQRCSGAVTGSRGTIIRSNGGYGLAQTQGTTFSFAAPSAVRFVGAEVYARTNTTNGFIASLFRSASDGLYPPSSALRCEQPGWNCTGTGSTDPFSAGNRIRVGAAHDNLPQGFRWSLKCAWHVCGITDANAFALYGAKVTLADDVAPTASPAGTDLAVGATVKGRPETLFTAQDAQSGLFRWRHVVDGVAQPWASADPDRVSCRDDNPANADDHEFGAMRPCRTSGTVTASLDTTVLSEGPHAVRLEVEDAGGNRTPVLSVSRIVVDNLDRPALVAGSEPVVTGTPRRGSSLVASAPSWHNGGVTGAPSLARWWETCRRDGSDCQAVSANGELLYVPGDADLNRRVRYRERATNSEGTDVVTSALTAVVTREDGTLPIDNNGLDDDGDGTVDEPGETAPTGSTGGGPVIGGDTASSAGATALSGGRGRDGAAGATGSAGSAASSAGALNGDGASARARLTAGFARGADRGRIAFGRDGVVTGRLTAEDGRPIANAIVEVAETPSLRGARAASASPAVTGADGTFTHRASSRGGTRSLVFAYRHLRGGAIVVQREVLLEVRAGVRLAVKLRGAVAAYSGRVLAGAMPRGGKLVIVQGRAKGGNWQTFASRRAGRTGAFKGRYRLKVRRPGKQLQFRVRVLTESGWNYIGVTSKPVTRRVR